MNVPRHATPATEDPTNYSHQTSSVYHVAYLIRDLETTLAEELDGLRSCRGYQTHPQLKLAPRLFSLKDPFNDWGGGAGM